MTEPRPTAAVWPYNEAKIQRQLAALKKKITIPPLDDSSLAEFVEVMAEQLKEEFSFDEPALDELGIGSDSPVSVDIRHEMTAEAALRLTLEKIDPELTWILQNEAVLITTKEQESDRLLVMVYDVSDILSHRPAAGESRDDPFASLASAIIGAIDPDDWNETGGTGRVQELEGPGIRALVISARLPTHLKIARLLTAIRSQRHPHKFSGSGESRPVREQGNEGGAIGGAAIRDHEEVALAKADADREVPKVAVAGPMSQETYDRLRAALQKDILIEAGDDRELGEMLREIAKKLALPIRIDEESLDELGIGTDSPISVEYSMNRSGENMISSILEVVDPELTFMLTDEAILVTTHETASQHLVTKIYDVADLCGLLEPAGGETIEAASFINLMHKVIEPVAWDVHGGAGFIVEVEAAGVRSLAVATTFQVHDQIEKVFVALRKIRRHEGFEGAGVEATTSVQAESETEARNRNKQVEVDEQKTATWVASGDVQFAERLAWKLEESVKFEGSKKEWELSDFVEFISDMLVIPIRIDEIALDELGIAPDAPLTFDLRQANTGRFVLDAALDQIDPELVWMIHHEGIWVTTREVESENPLVKVYDVADICGDCLTADGTRRSNFDALINLLGTVGEREAWDEVSWETYQVEARGIQVLVVATHRRRHKRIESLLAALRSMKRSDVGPHPCGEPWLRAEAEVSLDSESGQETDSENGQWSGFGNFGGGLDLGGFRREPVETAE